MVRITSVNGDDIRCRELRFSSRKTTFGFTSVTNIVLSHRIGGSRKYLRESTNADHFIKNFCVFDCQNDSRRTWIKKIVFDCQIIVFGSRKYCSLFNSSAFVDFIYVEDCRLSGVLVEYAVDKDFHSSEKYLKMTRFSLFARVHLFNYFSCKINQPN